jgi:hypothetical protein
MNSYNAGAMNGHYPAYSTGFKATPRKAKEENEEKSTSPKKETVLGKDFQNENFNYAGVAGLSLVSSGVGFLTEFSGVLPEKIPYGVGFGSIVGAALVGGLAWEKLRSDGAKKHNTELLDKLRNEENNS